MGDWGEIVSQPRYFLLLLPKIIIMIIIIITRNEYSERVQLRNPHNVVFNNIIIYVSYEPAKSYKG